MGKAGGQTGTTVTLNRYVNTFLFDITVNKATCRSTVYLLLLVTAAAMLLSAVYLILTRMFTRMIMHITLVLSIALNMYGLFFATLSICFTEASLYSGICVYYWITKYYCGLPVYSTRSVSDIQVYAAGAIIFTVIALLSLFSYFGFRSRIPLASLLLQVVMDVSKHHTSVYAVAFTALFMQAALAV